MNSLEGSIKKWEAIVAGTGEDEGTDNCPLCEEYVGNADAFCEKCPVKINTKKSFCHDTPYLRWAQHHIQDHRSAVLPHKPQDNCPTCHNLAKAELDFLKSLRSKGE